MDLVTSKGEYQSASENESVISSKTTSMLSGVESSSKSSDDTKLPQPAFQQGGSLAAPGTSRVAPGCTSRLDNVGFDSSDTRTLDLVVVPKSFKDPALMSTEDISAGGMVEDDDEDDFNY
jgi:hypothetical protein